MTIDYRKLELGGLDDGSLSLSIPLATGSENALELLFGEDEVVHLVRVFLGDQRAVEGLLLLGYAGLAGPDHAVELRSRLLRALDDRLEHCGDHLALLDRIDSILVAVEAEHLDLGKLALVLQGVDRP